MPMKFKPSSYTRRGGIKRGSHSYMSGASTASLQEALEASLSTPKFKDKVRKELVKRGAL